MTKPPKKVSLGRGLSSLLGPDLMDETPQDGPRESVQWIPITQLHRGPYQPRAQFPEEELQELALSIAEVGILQPILVRRADTGSYEIIAGERRWRGAQLAQLETVPVIVKDFTDRQVSEAALIENIQRHDLNPLEEAQAYSAMLQEFGYTQEQLATRVGKSRSHIANNLRLLKLPDPIKEMIHKGELTAGHARALLKSQDPEGLAQQIVDENLNVRDVEKRRKAQGTPRPRAATPLPKSEDIQHLEEQLSRILQLPTQIQMAQAQGSVIVHFSNLQELDDLIGHLNQLLTDSGVA